MRSSGTRNAPDPAPERRPHGGGTEGTAGIRRSRRRACPRIWRSRRLLRNFRFVHRVIDRWSRLEGIYLEERAAGPRDTPRPTGIHCPRYSLLPVSEYDATHWATKVRPQLDACSDQSSHCPSDARAHSSTRAPRCSRHSRAFLSECDRMVYSRQAERSCSRKRLSRAAKGLLSPLRRAFFLLTGPALSVSGPTMRVPRRAELDKPGRARD
jgi:hypothetical protein